MTLTAQLTKHLTMPLDAAIEEFLRLQRRIPGRRRFSAELTAFRQARSLDIMGSQRAELTRLAPGVLAGDQATVAAYDRWVHKALHRLRRQMPSDWRYFPARLDALLRGERPEMLDDPELPQAHRSRMLDILDRFHVHLGSYEAWADWLEPTVQRAARRGTRPVTVHDVAAGNAGFALALKERFGATIRMSASDSVESHLALGHRKAHVANLDISFAHLQPTQLQSLSSVDIVVCSQSLHHCSPGLVARMLGEAARVARVAVCFIDGERNLMPLLMTPLIMALYARSWPAVHDSIAAVRRMYVAEELGLLAYLAPGLPSGASIHCGRLYPGHGFVQINLPSAQGLTR